MHALWCERKADLQTIDTSSRSPKQANSEQSHQAPSQTPPQLGSKQREPLLTIRWNAINDRTIGLRNPGIVMWPYNIAARLRNRSNNRYETPPVRYQHNHVAALPLFFLLPKSDRREKLSIFYSRASGFPPDITSQHNNHNSSFFPAANPSLRNPAP